jgi:ribosomal protein S18 acetylase RimI-like enzyme
MMLKHVEDEARRRGLKTVVLGVNKGNAKAIKAYQRAGFTVRKSIKADIGGGFFMDDFIFEKKL